VAGFTTWLTEEVRSVLTWSNETGPQGVKSSVIRLRVVSIRKFEERRFEFDVVVETNE